MGEEGIKDGSKENDFVTTILSNRLKVEKIKNK